MREKSESVILCEGYYDRAFWAGWLEYLGCPRPKPGKVLDPHRDSVSGGQFGYYTPKGGFIRIVPCGGKPNVLLEARRRISDRLLDDLGHLVVCNDPDTSPANAGLTGLRAADIEREMHAIDPAARKDPSADIVLADGTKVSLVRWEIQNDPQLGVPSQQTLERLVCAALVAAYPDRGPAVQAWLEACCGETNPQPKSYAWSYMAGWYAECGCDAFYRTLWTDSKLVRELESRLKASGAWRIAELLLK